MLSEFELSNITASCAKTPCAGDDVTNLLDSQRIDCVVEPVVDPQPTDSVEPSLPDAPEGVRCPKFVDGSAVCVIEFPEDNVSQCLRHKFTEVSAQYL